MDSFNNQNNSIAYTFSSPVTGWRNTSEVSYQDEIQQNNWTVLDTTQGHQYHDETLVSPRALNFSNQHNNSWIQQPAADVRGSHSSFTGTWIAGYANSSPSSYASDSIDYNPMQQRHHNINMFPMPAESSNNQTAVDENWAITGYQGTDAIHHMSVLEIQAHVERRAFQQLNQPEQVSLVGEQSIEFTSDLQNTFNQYGVEDECLRGDGGDRYEASGLSFPVNSSPLIVGSDESVARRLICRGWGRCF